MGTRRVVVTGMGVITALGETVSSLWDALLAGRSGVRRITRFETADCTVHIGGECTDFDPTCVVDRKQAKRNTRRGIPPSPPRRP